MSARFVTGARDRSEDATPSASSSASWNTIKPRPKRGRPYAARLTFAFALTAIMTAAVLVAVLAIVWEGQFMAYTRQNMQAVADSTADLISDAYAQTGELDGETASFAGSASALSSDRLPSSMELTQGDPTGLSSSCEGHRYAALAHRMMTTTSTAAILTLVLFMFWNRLIA